MSESNADDTPDNHLADKVYRTFVLRLLVDRQGRLQRGTLIDTQAGMDKPFRSWRSLIMAIREQLSG